MLLRRAQLHILERDKSVCLETAGLEDHSESAFSDNLLPFVLLGHYVPRRRLLPHGKAILFLASHLNTLGQRGLVH